MADAVLGGKGTPRGLVAADLRDAAAAHAIVQIELHLARAKRIARQGEAVRDLALAVETPTIAVESRGGANERAMEVAALVREQAGERVAAGADRLPFAEPQRTDGLVDGHHRREANGVELDRSVVVPLPDPQIMASRVGGRAKDVVVPIPIARQKMISMGKAGTEDGGVAAADVAGAHLKSVQTARRKLILTAPLVAVVAVAGHFQDMAIDPASLSAGKRPAGRRRVALVEIGVGNRCGRRRGGIADGRDASHR